MLLQHLCVPVCWTQPLGTCRLAALLRLTLQHLLAQKFMEYVLAPDQHHEVFDDLTFSHGVLGVRRGGLIVRYIRAFATSFVSGTIHIILDLSAGLSLLESGAMKFFCTQIMGRGYSSPRLRTTHNTKS